MMAISCPVLEGLPFPIQGRANLHIKWDLISERVHCNKIYWGILQMQPDCIQVVILDVDWKYNSNSFDVILKN